MNEMVERVARALAARHYALRFAAATTDEIVLKNVDANWQMFDMEAITAIKAMREPTETMSDAADNWGRGAREDWSEAYRVMIDAALSPS